MAGEGHPIAEIADLTTLANGAALEKFQAELAAVLENIKDPNTEAKAKRKIVVEVSFLPAEDRALVAVNIQAKSTMAATKPAGGAMFVGKHKGELVGTVIRGGGGIDPRQGMLELKKKGGDDNGK